VTGVDPATTMLDGEPLIDLLMAPTKIYVKTLLGLIAQTPVHALAHITGGGLLENIPRVLPDSTKAVIDTKAWKRPAIFDWLQSGGNIDEQEMHRTLNCGVGMVICVPPESVQTAMDFLDANGEDAFILGKIEASQVSEEQVQLRGLI
jgi:phosphoribosylformylglycinamidine cyclo-ligase